MIKQAKKRGYVTYEQLNAVMPSEEVTSEQIEDVLAMMNEMGINVVETEEAETDEEEPRGARGGRRAKAASSSKSRPKPPAKSEAKEPTERTDDPVRMYLREMGSVELLSREGEIAIAKRIEAGREAMIAGLCESPLSFQAIIIWRDELNEGKVFLRDIIDLEATYAGPDAKQVPAAGARRRSCRGARQRPGRRSAARRSAVPAPPSAPPAATPFKPQPARGAGEEGGEEAAIADSRHRRGRSGEFDVARRDRGRAQAESAGDLRQHRRQLQAAAPPAGAGHPEQAALNELAVAGAGAQIQEAQGRDHPGGEVAAAQPGSASTRWSSSSTTSTSGWSATRAA